MRPIWLYPANPVISAALEGIEGSSAVIGALMPVNSFKYVYMGAF